MGENSRTTANALKIIAAVLALIFLFSGILLVVDLLDNGDAPSDSYGIGSTLKYNGKEYTHKKNIETLLIMGLDKFSDDITESSYNNDRQADFIMLLVVDHDAKSYTAIHINRDTMAQVNILGLDGRKVSSVNKQIALAHTYGDGDKVSCRNVADSVSALLESVNVDNYLSLTMDSVAAVNDLVGGVELELIEDFSDIDPELKKGSTVTLKGEQALTYVRTRYGLEDSTNQTRMQRQQQYLSALFDKVMQLQKTDDAFASKAIGKLTMVSNRSATRLETLFNKLSEYELKGIKEFSGENKKGEKFMEFYPDKDSVKKIVIELFYEER